MKVRQRILLDLGVFLTCLVVSATILYKEVYTEEGVGDSRGLVLISEVRPTGGVGKSNDEFVELYNPQIVPVIIGGWSINKMTKSASSTDRQQLFVFPAGLVIPSRSHVLVAHIESSVTSSADYVYAGQALSDDNTVVLLNDSGAIIDLVGYGLAKNSETETAEAPIVQLLSIERKPGAELGNGYDTNNNKVDWFRAQSTPQNLYSPPTPLVSNAVQTTPSSTPEIIDIEPAENIVNVTSTVEVINLSPSSTDLMDSETLPVIETTSTEQINSGLVMEVGVQSSYPTSSQYLIGSILITELYPMPKSGENEFVELFNRTPQTLDLTNWYIIDGGGAKTFVSGTLASMHYLVIEKPKGSLNNTGDSVSLIAPNETVIDTVSYGEWDDGTPGNNAPGSQTGFSIVRLHDTEDSNLDYFDFGLSTTSTMGRVNVYLPVTIPEDQEESVVIPVTSSNSTLNTKVVVKKIEPLYPRIIYQATTTVGKEIFFDASLSTGGEGVKQYIWEMDDGAILRGEMVSHVYQLTDTYSVVLTILDSTGTEKHKTVKVSVVSDSAMEIENKSTKKNEKEVIVAATKKADPLAVFTQIGDLPKTKTNSLVRVRGVLSAVFTTKTGSEFYFIGESAAGGVAVGTLVKTKNSDIDARVGDVVEISGKYITNATSGNYIQYGTDDHLSIISSGEVITPLKVSIKSALQLRGGYVQISGEVVEKKTSYLIVSDKTGEIKLTGNIGENIKLNDRLVVIGYVVPIKEGVTLRTASNDDLAVQENVTTTTELRTVNSGNPNRLTTAGTVIGGVFCILLGTIIKKLWFSKKNVIEATEI